MEIFRSRVVFWKCTDVYLNDFFCCMCIVLMGFIKTFGTIERKITMDLKVMQDGSAILNK